MKLKTVNRKLKTNQRGFTIIETLLVLVLVGIFIALLLVNLRGSSTNSIVLERAALAIISDIRRAQSLSLAGVGYQNNPVCGFGVNYIDNETYRIYAGGENVCSTSNKNYQSGNDFTYQQTKLTEKNVEIKSSFNDIFFVPPDPKTYINNSFSLSLSPLSIVVGFKGMACPAYCKTILIYPSGKVDLN